MWRGSAPFLCLSQRSRSPNEFSNCFKNSIRRRRSLFSKVCGATTLLPYRLWHHEPVHRASGWKLLRFRSCDDDSIIGIDFADKLHSTSTTRENRDAILRVTCEMFIHANCDPNLQHSTSPQATARDCAFSVKDLSERSNLFKNSVEGASSDCKTQTGSNAHPCVTRYPSTGSFWLGAVAWRIQKNSSMNPSTRQRYSTRTLPASTDKLCLDVRARDCPSRPSRTNIQRITLDVKICHIMLTPWCEHE